MMLNRPVLLAASLLLVATATLAVAGAAAPAVVRPEPLSQSVQVGATFVVQLFVQDIVDAYGVDVRMCFDPQILEAQDADPLAPGIQIQPLSSFMQPGFVIKREASNTPDATRDECQTGGRVWYAFTQLNPAEPKSGSGPVAAVTFKARRAGISSLTIAYHKASSRSGDEIATAAQDGSVVVGGSGAYRLLLPIITR